MLPARHRLRGDARIKRVVHKGRSFFSPLLTMKILSNNLPRTRCTVVVSTRVSKKAVDRNKLKRRLRELVRHRLPRIPQGYDFMLIAKQQAHDARFPRLEQDIDFLFNKARLYDH